jgi:hypothetical protein
LVNIGVQEEDYTSEWASPTFAISKKNRNIRVVSALRKRISKRKRHPLKHFFWGFSKYHVQLSQDMK